MSPEELEPKEGITRRKMIKRIGAGAAIAWTAPVLTSLKTPAFAQSVGCPNSSGCDLSQPCNFIIPCGDGSCACWVNAAHSACFCGSAVQFCGDCGNCPSGQDSECPSGRACIDTCCGFTCADPCGGACVGSKNSSGARTHK